MSLPPIPPPLDRLRNRTFSFYPAILNIEHNEWQFRKATWSEILVANAKTNEELWIPRRFVGEISPVEDPVTIVGLVKELEYKGGAVWPYQRRIIQMPVAVNAPPVSRPVERAEPAAVVGIRVQSGTDSRIFRLIGGTLVVGILAYFAVVSVYREGVLRPRITYTTQDQSYLELTARDDYYDVVRKLGPPAEDRWQTETGEIQYRALHYPRRSYTVILMGGSRQEALYIGTMDSKWNAVHSVQQRGGGTTTSMLRGLKRF